MDVEIELLPVLRKNGIGFVPYSPLVRGMLTGKLKQDSIKDVRRLLPRTSDENNNENMKLVDRLKTIADSRNITLSQLSLDWVLHTNNLAPVIIENTSGQTDMMQEIDVTSVLIIYRNRFLKQRIYTI